MKRPWLWIGGIVMCLAAGSLQGADVEQVYTVPLTTFAYDNGGSTSYKYGILIGIGGGTPQMFEFDTGGEGFYAAYSANATWWGSNGTSQGPFSPKTFGSGITYSGNVVEMALQFYQPGGPSPVFSTGATTPKIGQSTNITDGSSTLWPESNENIPPVEDHFYGDFGLTLKRGSSGIENVFAQLTYGNGITGGYKVSVGPYGSTSGAYVQVGLSAPDLSNPETLWFEMQGQDTNDPFPGADAFPTYSAELLATAMTLSHGTNTHTFYDLGVNLDTGNPTPGLDFNPGDKATLDPFSEKSGSDLVALLEGTTLMLEALTIPPTTGDPFPTVFQLTAGQGYGVNFVYEKERTDGGETYLNVGALIFQQYDVTYDIENGRLGLTPIPEPSTALLVVSAAFVLRALQRRARLQPMGRITRRGDPLLTRHPRESHPAGSGALEEAEPASCL